jgi:hypothetical protein
MHPALTLAVYALAVARATRLVTSDRITEAPRRWLSIRLWARTINDPTAAGRLPAMAVKHGPRVAARELARERFDGGGDPPLAVYLLSCPWCASIWLGAAAAPLWYWLGSNPWLLVPAVALAFSYVTGFLASKEG